MARIIVSAAQTGKSCPYCRFPLKGGTEAMACDRCGAIHHLDCWSEGGGCAVVGCIADHALEETTEMAAVDRSRKVIPVFKEAPRQPLPPPGTQAVSEPAPDGPSAGGNGRAILVGLGCGLVIVVLGLGALFLIQNSNSDEAGPTATSGSETTGLEAQIEKKQAEIRQMKANGPTGPATGNQNGAQKMSFLLSKSVEGRSLSVAGDEAGAIRNRREILNSLRAIDGTTGGVESARQAFISAMRESILANEDRLYNGLEASPHDDAATQEKQQLMAIWNSRVSSQFGVSPIASEGDI